MSDFSRSSGSKAKKSRVLKLSISTLNLYFLYLLFSASWLLTSVKYLFGITLFFFIFDWISKSKTKSQHFQHRRSSFIDFFKLSRKYYKINKRYVLVSTLGLILATIMISQTILTNSSYQQNSLESFLANENSTGFQIELYRNNLDLQDPNYIQGQISSIEEVVKLELEKSFLNFDYGITYISTEIQLVNGPYVTQDDGSRFIDLYYLPLYIWNDDIATTLQNLPTFNRVVNQSDSLLILNQWTSPEDAPNLFTDLISISVGDPYRSPDDNTSFHYINQTVDQRWIPTNNDLNKISLQNNWKFFQIMRNSLIVSETRYFEILQEMKIVSNTNGIEYFQWTSIINDIHVTIPDLSTVSINQLIFELDQMTNSIRSSLLSKPSIQDVSLYSPLAQTLEQYKFERASFGVALIMISLPLIGVSLFLVYFSLTLVEKRKSKVIAIMKIRGSSKQQLRYMQFAEILVAGTIAAIAGMILSIPWALITFRVSDFFEFKADPIDLVIPASWYLRLPQIAVILTIDLNLNSLLSLSDTRIDEGEDAEEKKPPFWQRLYIDLILFSLSVGILLFIRTFPISDTLLLNFLLFGIAPWALMIILITSPLVVSRYFSTVISLISDFLWRVQGGMLALATRNMRKNRFSSSRLTALLMLGMMLSFVSIIIPTSIVSYGIENANYQVGADVYISNLDINNQTLLDLAQVEGVESRTEVVVAGINLFSNDNSDYRGNIGYYKFLGVNTTTFAKTAYWRNNYADKDLGNIISKIEYDTVGTSNKQLSALGVEQGGIVPNLPQNVSNVKVAVTFNYFPNLVTYEPIDYGDYVDAWSVQFLGHIDYVKSLENESDVYTTGLYLKLLEGANRTKVDELLANNFANNDLINIRSVNQELYNIQEAEEFQIILSSFQSMLIITVLISIIAVSYFTFITLSERNKEIGTFRAIGMVKNQIFVLLIVEAMIMLVSGIVFGAVTGWFISSYFFYIISNPSIGGIIPPQRLYIPLRLTLGFLGAMFVSTGVATAIPAHKVASKQTGNILRAE